MQDGKSVRIAAIPLIIVSTTKGVLTLIYEVKSSSAGGVDIMTCEKCGRTEEEDKVDINRVVIWQQEFYLCTDCEKKIEERMRRI